MAGAIARPAQVTATSCAVAGGASIAMRGPEAASASARKDAGRPSIVTDATRSRRAGSVRRRACGRREARLDAIAVDVARARERDPDARMAEPRVLPRFREAGGHLQHAGERVGAHAEQALDERARRARRPDRRSRAAIRGGRRRAVHRPDVAGADPHVHAREQRALRAGGTPRPAGPPASSRAPCARSRAITTLLIDHVYGIQSVVDSTCRPVGHARAAHRQVRDPRGRRRASSATLRPASAGPRPSRGRRSRRPRSGGRAAGRAGP